MLWARWAPPRKVPSHCQQLQRLPRWDLRAEPKRTGQAAPVPKEETKGTEAGKELPAAKRVAVETREAPHNTEIKTVAGDGSCLYHSFAGAMQALHDVKLDPLTLRAEVITHLGKHQERYVQQWNGEAPDGTRIWSEFTSSETKQEAFAKYLALSKPSTAWAGELEASALGRQYDTKTIIVPRVASFRLACLRKKSKQTVALWFTGEHFDILLPTQGKTLPQELTKIVDDLTYDIRAGGKSKAETVWTSAVQTTRKSVAKRSVRPDPVWTPTSKRPPKSAKQSIRPGTVWTQESEQNLDGFDLDEPAASAKPTSLTRHMSPFATGSGYQAKCIYCPWVYQNDCKDRVRQARRGHYVRAHPEQPIPDLKRKVPDIKFENVRQIPEDQLAWKCGFCSQGIRKYEGYNRQHILQVTRAHRKTKHPTVTVRQWQSTQLRLRYKSSDMAMRKRIFKRNSHVASMALRELMTEQWQAFTMPKFSKPRTDGRRAQFSIISCFRCKACGGCYQTTRARRHKCGTTKVRLQCTLWKLKKHRLLALKEFKTKGSTVMAGFQMHQVEEFFRTAFEIVKGEMNTTIAL